MNKYLFPNKVLLSNETTEKKFGKSMIGKIALCKTCGSFWHVDNGVACPVCDQDSDPNRFDYWRAWDGREFFKNRYEAPI